MRPAMPISARGGTVSHDISADFAQSHTVTQSTRSHMAPRLRASGVPVEAQPPSDVVAAADAALELVWRRRVEVFRALDFERLGGR